MAHPTTRPLADAVIERIEGFAALDDVSERIRVVLEPLLSRDRIRDALTGRWGGHPVHPAAVMLPMSCWLAATLLDATGGERGRPFAQRLTGLGVVAAAPAALAGAMDWADTQDAEQRVGMVHATVNGVATGLFAWSWWLRRSGHHRRGVATALVASTLAGGAGFLGGHLTYRRGVGVDTTAFQSGPEEWTVLEVDAPGTDEPDPVRHAMIGDLDMVVVRRHEGPPAVLESRCSHRGGPLHEGEVSGGCISCPWHGSRFDIVTGHVRLGPASAPQPAYESRFTADGVEIRRTERGSLRRYPIGASAVETSS